MKTSCSMPFPNYILEPQLNNTSSCWFEAMSICSPCLECGSCPRSIDKMMQVSGWRSKSGNHRLVSEDKLCRPIFHRTGLDAVWSAAVDGWIFFSRLINKVGGRRHSGTVSRNAASQFQDPWFGSPVSTWVSSGVSSFIPTPRK